MASGSVVSKRSATKEFPPQVMRFSNSSGKKENLSYNGPQIAPRWMDLRKSGSIKTGVELDIYPDRRLIGFLLLGTEHLICAWRILISATKCKGWASLGPSLRRKTHRTY